MRNVRRTLSTVHTTTSPSPQTVFRRATISTARRDVQTAAATSSRSRARRGEGQEGGQPGKIMLWPRGLGQTKEGGKGFAVRRKTVAGSYLDNVNAISAGQISPPLSAIRDTSRAPSRAEQAQPRTRNEHGSPRPPDSNIVAVPLSPVMQSSQR